MTKTKDKHRMETLLPRLTFIFILLLKKLFYQSFIGAFKLTAPCAEHGAAS